MSRLNGVCLGDLSRWPVAVADDALPSERYAAEEWASFVRQAGGSPALVPASDAPRQSVRIGPGAVSGDRTRYGEEDFRIRIGPGRVSITGGRPRGTLYGVYTFLEDYLGVRFLASDCTHVPPLEAGRILQPADRFYHPPFAFRWPYYYETNNNPVMATRQRTNTIQAGPAILRHSLRRMPPMAGAGKSFPHDDPRFGSVSPIRLIDHSFFRLLPAAEFAQEHPDYFCERDGRRRALDLRNDHIDLQPCLTSPDVLRIVTERVLAELDAEPRINLAVVGQNDNGWHCTCARCRALDEREGSPMGSLLAFVNAVADAVARRRPDALVGTLAYQYSRRPPRTVKPRPNVAIQLCTIECCTVHALDDPACVHNVPFREDLEGWSRICDRICIWNYHVNFLSLHSPYPNLRSLERNVRFFAAHGVKALFMQAASGTPAAELSDLRNYLISSLLWDPARSARQGLHEFLDGYYGRAGGPIRVYLDTLHNRVLAGLAHTHKTAGCHVHLGEHNVRFGIDAECVACGLRCFAEAEALAETPAILERVQRASLCAYRAALDPLFQAVQQATPRALPPDERARLEPLARRFFERCRRAGVTQLRIWEQHEWTAGRADRNQLDMIAARIRDVLGLDLSAPA